MGFLGLVPAESWTGEAVRRKGLTWPAIDAPAGQVQGRRTQVQPILRNGIVYCGPSWIYRTRTAVR
jgi:hypothetical protein